MVLGQTSFGESLRYRPELGVKRASRALGPAEFAGGCVPVSKVNAASESDVWLLTLVLDGASRATELRVLDGSDVTAPPVATVRLPHVVPIGFHGNWVSIARRGGMS